MLMNLNATQTIARGSARVVGGIKVKVVESNV